MKIIAVVSRNALSSKQFESYLVPIHGYPVTIGLLDIPKPDFDPNKDSFENCVLVRKKAFSLNFRDTGLIFSANAYLQKQQEHLRYLAIGSEFVGIVEAVGSSVSELKVGDRVIGNAAYPYSEVEGLGPGLPTNSASKQYEIFHASKLISIPNSLPDDVAAGFMIGAQTSYGMIRRSEVQATDTCLVTAASSNTSLFLIAALRQRCARVIALTTSHTNVQPLLKLGAHKVVVVERKQALDKCETFQAMIKEEGKFNVIYDPYCDLYAGQLISHMSTYGRYLTCGVYNQYSGFINEQVPYQGDIPLKLMANVILNNISLIGNCLGKKEDLLEAIDAYSAGNLPVIIDSIFTLDQIPDFFDRTYNSRSRFGKVIMKYE